MKRSTRPEAETAAPRFDAVILDMDGVLVDSEAQWKQAERPFFKEIVPDWREKDFERIVGLGVLDLHRMLAEEYRLALSLERFLERCDELAEEVYGRRVRLAPELAEFLSELRRLGLPAALASSSPRHWIRKVLDRFGLHSRFEAVVGADDVGGEGKPSPAVYLRAATLLKTSASRCLAVEDSACGVLSAKRAGAFCVGLRNGSNAEQDLSLADGQASGFGELIALLPRRGRRFCAKP